MWRYACPSQPTDTSRPPPHLHVAAEDPDADRSIAEIRAAAASKSAFESYADSGPATLSTDEGQAEASAPTVDGPETAADDGEQGPQDDDENGGPSEELLRRLALTNSKLTASNSALEADLERIDVPEHDADGPDDVQPPIADERNAAAHTATVEADAGPAAGFGANFDEPATANGVSAPSGEWRRLRPWDNLRRGDPVALKLRRACVDASMCAMSG